MSTYTWNFSDIFAIIWCRALTDRFKAFNEHITAKFTTSFIFKGSKNNIYASEGIRTDFQRLLKLNDDTAGFISPLLISCYCYNIFLMILNIFRWLDPRGTGDTERSTYIYFSFLQFSMRVILITYHASNVHHSTIPIEKSLERIPDELVTKTLERLEAQLCKRPVGIFLFGTFCITRYFFISIVSFLFTTEIVLLQTVGSGQGSQSSGGTVGQKGT
ncbi:unnamed protein product [Orchesella dallaii]|uniref:Uncharacterized protein n=1 Tax=Orchesella dallaii TaxID=48710 RepID=A0ABP1Q985_9HEXA